MPPKAKFTGPQIVDAAFAVACREGMDGITIRKIAEEIGSSTAPVYINFRNGEELRDAVVEKIIRISTDILKETQTDGNTSFYTIGLAGLKFAYRYPVLVQDLVLRPNRYIQRYRQHMNGDLTAWMADDPDLKDLSESELEALLVKMQIFQTGLTVMIATGQLPEEMDEHNLMKMLTSAADAFIAAARTVKE